MRRTGQRIELRPDPYRLELDPLQWRYAKSEGEDCVINCDVHRNEHTGFLHLTTASPTKRGSPRLM